MKGYQMSKELANEFIQDCNDAWLANSGKGSTNYQDLILSWLDKLHALPGSRDRAYALFIFCRSNFPHNFTYSEIQTLRIALERI